MSQYKKHLRWFDMNTEAEKENFKAIYELAKEDPNSLIREDFGDLHIFIKKESTIEI